MKALTRLVAIFAALAMSSCLGDAQTVDQLCETWNKSHLHDDNCGKGVAAVEDPSGGGGDKPCNGDDVDKAEQAGGLAGVIGKCFYSAFASCEDNADCMVSCIESKGTSGGCAECVGSDPVRGCMNQHCRGFDACLNIPFAPQVGSESKCIACAKAHCMINEVKDCGPPAE